MGVSLLKEEKRGGRANISQQCKKKWELLRKEWKAREAGSSEPPVP